jgi:hypothetical protein
MIFRKTLAKTRLTQDFSFLILKVSNIKVKLTLLQGGFNMSQKTNAARILDQAGISYKLIPYEVDESDLSAVTVARKVGMPPEQIFKSIVIRGDKTGVLIACIPADKELNLKALAQLSGNKKVEVFI